MKFAIIERLKFKMIGRSVPVIEVSDVDNVGKVGTIRLRGELKKRNNSIVATWDATGYEIHPGQTMTMLIDEKDTTRGAYIVSESGRAISLYTRPLLPNEINCKDLIGRLATADDIADAIDLGKSMRYLMIGGLFGLGIGTFILGPALQAVMA